ncbi:MAG TPA: EI24 domain-containing protein [Burkholderiales bacterium]|nr:EI24 domain-containing protein [Burkholderiales bacterium]
MKDIAGALIGATQSIVRPAIAKVVLVPMAAALTGWILVGWLYWKAWTAGAASALVSCCLHGWLAGLEAAAPWLAALLVLALLVLAVLLTATLIATVSATPMLVEDVARSDFPTLEKRRGGTFAGSLRNALAAIGKFALLWIAVLPLWLLVPALAWLPLALLAWLNLKLFGYDALAQHADAAEMQRISEAARGRMFVLGLVTGVPYFVPLLNLVAPIFAALAFIHFCLGELRRARAAEKEIRTA